MKKLLVALALVAVGIALVGCGTEAVNSAPERVVKIGHIKGTLINLPEDVLKFSGLLEKAGVKYQFVDVASSNEVYEAIVRGDIDVTGLVSYLPVILNYDKQPDAVKIFAASNLSVDEKYDYILVKNGSDLKELKDLSGKKLKYGLFPGSTHTTFTKLYLKSLGVDISNIEFIQLPPQNHLQALEAGSIDVLGTYDPMASVALAKGDYRVIGYSVYANTFDHTPLGVGIMNSKFVEKFPDLAKKVAQAHQQAYDLMIADPANSHKVIADVYKIDPAVADKVNIPKYATQLSFDRDALQKLTDYLFKVGEAKSDPNISGMIVSY